MALYFFIWLNLFIFHFVECKLSIDAQRVINNYCQRREMWESFFLFADFYEWDFSSFIVIYIIGLKTNVRLSFGIKSILSPFLESLGFTLSASGRKLIGNSTTHDIHIHPSNVSFWIWQDFFPIAHFMCTIRITTRLNSHEKKKNYESAKSYTCQSHSFVLNPTFHKRQFIIHVLTKVADSDERQE